MSFMCKNKKSLIRHTIQMSHYLTASIKPSYMAYLSRLIENSDLPRDAHSECSLCIRAEVTVTRRIASHCISSVTSGCTCECLYIHAMQCAHRIGASIAAKRISIILFPRRRDALPLASTDATLHGTRANARGHA